KSRILTLSKDKAFAHSCPMTYRTLSWDVVDRVLILKLNRPEQLNAFTVEMANELVDAFGRASLDDGVGAVVVTGAGRAFCAG
ncbi:enoyl-CoA hydratase-related protein, partial [Salmonella enterica]|uniref:enoyl-CoA hydratase-related protein n=1 Tax=Salmonella enterica TaxID=28901 RepID=UPI0032B52178